MAARLWLFREEAIQLDKDGQLPLPRTRLCFGTAKGLVVKRWMCMEMVITITHQLSFGQTQVSDATSEGLKGQTQTGKPNLQVMSIRSSPTLKMNN